MITRNPVTLAVLIAVDKKNVSSFLVDYLAGERESLRCVFYCIMCELNKTSTSHP